MDQVKQIFSTVKDDYLTKQTMKTRMIDAFVVYCALTALVQLIYCVLVGTYPFNSFLSGFICHVALFSLGVSLRWNANEGIQEGNLADFVFCGLVLFFVVWSFMG